jgi:squalene-hopene cyclase
MQLPDGGWNIYYGGPSEVNATIKAYLALKLAGVPVTDPRMLQAREVALHLGGVPRMNTFSKLYLALLGLFPWQYVPTIPCEVLLIGKWFHVNFWDMSNWSRGMLVPLSIINHFKPTRPPKSKVSLDELYPEGMHERDLAIARDPERFTLRNFFLWLDRLHKFAERFARRGVHPFRKRALKKAEQWMLERFEGADGLAAIFPAMLNSLIALQALGYPDDHPQVVRAAHELKKLEHETKDSVRIEPCFSPVWDTAIVLICLHESGISENHPLMKKAAEWLMEKEIRFRGDWVHKNPAKVEPSGWVFEFNNKWNPDVDDAAMVLLALRKIPTDNPKKRDECFQRGLRWMLTFQCKDGGWAAFDKNCTKNILEKVPFADHNAMLDPECADITARILELLGYENFSTEHPQVQDALQYIRRQQEYDGSWYGRWGVNYIYGTWQVLAWDARHEFEHEPAVAAPCPHGSKASSTKTAAGANAATPTTIRFSKAAAPAPPHKPRGPSWAVRVRRSRESRTQTRHRISLPHAERRRFVDGTRDDRHRFPKSLLLEIRHVSQCVAAAGPGDVSENFGPRQNAARQRRGQWQYQFNQERFEWRDHAFRKVTFWVLFFHKTLQDWVMVGLRSGAQLDLKTALFLPSENRILD